VTALATYLFQLSSDKNENVKKYPHKKERMKSMSKLIRTLSALTIAVSATLIATPADAATFTWNSRPLTNLNPAGTTVTGSIANFPTKTGLYIFQCVKAQVAGQRPASDKCFDLAWVTANGGQGSTAAKDPISFVLRAQYSTATQKVDCSLEECGVFFRYDRAAPTDTSADLFLPISFTQAITPIIAKAADSITVTLNGNTLTRNVPINLGYRAKTVIVATASSGLPVTLASATPDCTYANGAFTALKGSGVCRLSATTAGNDTFDAASVGYPFNLVPGNQRLGLGKFGVKKGATRVLPAATDFGSPVMYTTKGKNCVITGNNLRAAAGKGCLITATAAGKDGMWLPLQSSIRVTIR